MNTKELLKIISDELIKIGLTNFNSYDQFENYYKSKEEDIQSIFPIKKDAIKQLSQYF
jgi:hypothetical protein